MPKFRISYDYVSPGPGGPFRGRDTIESAERPVRGDTIPAIFGRATIRSVSEIVTDEDLFNRHRAAYNAAQERIDAIREKHIRSHGEFNRAWMSASDQRKLESANKADEKARDAMFALLDRISPRYWRSGVASHWVMTELTYADAITHGPLSTLPDGGYGSLPDDVRRFSAALSNS